MPHYNDVCTSCMKLVVFASDVMQALMDTFNDDRETATEKTQVTVYMLDERNNLAVKLKKHWSPSLC